MNRKTLTETYYESKDPLISALLMCALYLGARLDALGMNGAATPFGALENLALEVRNGLRSLDTSIQEGLRTLQEEEEEE